MIAFNLSVDFELAWGDLERVAHDDAFYQRVVSGLEHTRSVIDVLDRRGIPSTWGVVGACSCSSLEELRDHAPQAFGVVEKQLETLMQRRPAYLDVLFCPDTVKQIAKSSVIELGSHSFMHLLPKGLKLSILQDDVSASVRTLRGVAGTDVESFIPPQNCEWPDAAFEQTSIRYVRHTPHVFGYAYSDARMPAKLSRLWNDFIRPVRQRGGDGSRAQLLFLRIDRGQRLWDAQLALIRRLLASGSGSLFCFTHPHNLDSTLVVQRFAQLCELVGEARELGRLTFRKFFRELHASPAATARA